MGLALKDFQGHCYYILKLVLAHNNWFKNFDVVIPKLKLLGQNLHLRCAFQISEISEGFDYWFSWPPYRRVTFKDTCFYGTSLLAQNKLSSILQETRVIKLFRPNVCNNDVITSIKISKFVKPLLRSQYICFKDSVNSYFNPFVATFTWCVN